MAKFTTEIINLNNKMAKSIEFKGLRKDFQKIEESEEGDILFVKFDGDNVDPFTQFEMDMRKVLLNHGEGDEVYLLIESPGGSAVEFFAAAEHIKRLQSYGVHVTAFIDKIAASGGYVLASACDYVVANPSAIVGSIGVVTEQPIVEEFMNRLGVDYRTYTAGSNKRNVTMYREPTPEQEAHLQKELDEIHQAFKDHVTELRTNVTEEQMDGSSFLAKNVVGSLVDEIYSSESAITEAIFDGRTVYHIKTDVEVERPSLLQRLTGFDLQVFMKNIAEQIVRVMEKRDTINLIKR